MRTGYDDSLTSSEPRRTAPSMIHVSHQMENEDEKRVSHPAPLTPPSITLRSNAPKTRPPPLAKPFTNRKSYSSSTYHLFSNNPCKGFSFASSVSGIWVR